MRALGFEPRKEETKKMLRDVEADRKGRRLSSGRLTYFFCLSANTGMVQLPSIPCNASKRERKSLPGAREQKVC